MANAGPGANGTGGHEFRLRMLYGVNQADQCRDFALGEARARIGQMLRDIDTRMVRLFLFDKGAPDPVGEWPVFSAYVQAVLDVGAVPMITFAKLHRPLDDPRAVRWFANQCGDVVWSCLEQWGPAAVCGWYWCVWNEPNNAWISGPVSFEQYRRLYEAVAEQVVRWLGPHLSGAKPLIGGPAVAGFQPFWWDWPYRFVHEIDNRLIGFVDWHRYADWRDYGEYGAPWDREVYEGLLMSQAADYGLRARAIGELVRGRDILNICGELNAHSHYTEPVRARFNQSVFGAAVYTTAVLHLIRGGADAEMSGTGTEDRGGYGMMNRHGEPWPVFHAKRLLVEHVRRGDWVSFPAADPAVDVAVARGDDGRRSAVIVHLKGGPGRFAVADLIGNGAAYTRLLKFEAGTGGAVAEVPFDGTVEFDGYGVAAVTTG